MKTQISLILLALVSCAVHAQPRVVGITDGDTLTVLNDDKTTIKVRLSAIDAPEMRQPFGMQSKKALSDICFNKPVRLEVVDIDRYGRTVADVYCSGVNAGRTMVAIGMAWVYDKYAKAVKYQSYYADQSQAQRLRIGLWREPNQTPPWEWRSQ
ncbi:MAG: thermonuclease family protein [Burkholderiales bacterium]|nr:thermonuclease family protein [Burkholderiales bacterium]